MKHNKDCAITELYKRVMPALKSKQKEFSLNKLTCITENMIWNCLRETKWGKGKVTNLTLYDVVDDIFNLTEQEIIHYLNHLEKRKKHD